MIFLFITIILSGILGALGGAENSSKLYRRLGIPMVLILNGYLILHTHWTYSLLLLILPLSIGYGTYDSSDPKNSLLIEFFYKKTQSIFKASYFTKGIIALVTILCLLPIVIIKHNYIPFIIGSIGIILTYLEISIKDNGTFYLFKKQLLKTDFYVYSLLTSCILIIIYY